MSFSSTNSSANTQLRALSDAILSSAVVSLCFKVTQKPRHWGDYAPNDGVLFVELDGLIQGSNTQRAPCEASRGVRERVGKFLEDLSGLSFVHGNRISRISALA